MRPSDYADRRRRRVFFFCTFFLYVITAKTLAKADGTKRTKEVVIVPLKKKSCIRVTRPRLAKRKNVEKKIWVLPGNALPLRDLGQRRRSFLSPRPRQTVTESVRMKMLCSWCFLTALAVLSSSSPSSSLAHYYHSGEHPYHARE